MIRCFSSAFLSATNANEQNRSLFIFFYTPTPKDGYIALASNVTQVQKSSRKHIFESPAHSLAKN